MLAITTLIFLSLMAQSVGPAEGPVESSVESSVEISEEGSQVVPLGAATVNVARDGTPYVFSYSRTDPQATAELLGSKAITVVPHFLLLVDRQGIAWVHGDGRIMGYRGDQVVQEPPEAMQVRSRTAAEDARGRVWFAGPERIVCFDGIEWRQWKTPFEPDKHHQSTPQVESSSDGSRIYVWQRSAPGFVDSSGDRPEPRFVSQANGLRDSSVWELVPVGRSSVLTRPSFSVLSAERWLTIPPAKAPLMHVKHASRFIGPYELSHHPILVTSDGGPPLLYASWATDWGKNAGRAEEHRMDPAWDRSAAERVVPLGLDVRFKITEEHGIRRLSQVEERFGATYIDRMGRHWRVDQQGVLARLEGTRALMLVDAKTQEPIQVDRRIRSDQDGRVYLRTRSYERFAWLPPGLGRKSKEGAEDRFAWKEVENRVWTAADEDLALARVKKAVEEEAVSGADSMARILSSQALAGEALKHPKIWGEITSPLAILARHPAKQPAYSWAKVAIAIGLRDRAESFLRKGLAAERTGSAKDQARALMALTTLADNHGFTQVALAGYDQALSDPTTPEEARVNVLRAAADLAVRARRYDLALQRNHELVSVARTWMRDDAIRGRDLLAQLTAASRATAAETAEAHITFVTAYFQQQRVPRGKQEAWLHLLESFELTPDQQRRAHLELLRLALQAQDRTAAREQALAIAKTEDAPPEACASALAQVAFSNSGERDAESLLRDYREVYERYPSTRAAVNAKCGAARVHLSQGRPNLGIALLKPCLEEAARRRQENPIGPRADLHGAAFLLSQCHEAAGDIEQALKNARACLTTYPFQTFCGTCSDSQTRKIARHIERLEGL